MIVCFGTNDTANKINFKNSVIRARLITPGLLGSVSHPAMTEIYAKLESLLTSRGVTHVDTPRLMISTPSGEMSSFIQVWTRMWMLIMY